MRIIAPMPKKNLLVRQNCAAILQPLWAKNFKSETTSLNYFSPRIPTIKKVWTFDFGKWGKKLLNGVNKWKNPEWHIPPDTWHITHHTWNLTLDMWNITHWEWLTLSKNSDIWLWQFRSNGVMWQMKLDMWHVTWGDMWHATCDMGQMTCYRWHLTCDTWHKGGGENYLKM